MSSPVRPARANAYTISSSSPDLPPLRDILNLRKSPVKPPPRSGSNAAPIPATARQTFTSAADILREAPEIDIDTEQVTNSPPRKSKTTRKPRTKAQPSKKAPSVAAADTALEISLSPKRFKSSKASPDIDQPAPAKGRVTKPKAPEKKSAREKKNGKKNGKKKGESDSHHFAAPSEPEKEATKSQQQPEPGTPQPRPYALARRTDWTPPTASIVTIPDSESENGEFNSSPRQAASSKDAFRTLYKDYACKPQEREARPEPTHDVLGKRKRLEFVGHAADKVVAPAEAPPMEAPPMEAPPIEAPPMEAPPLEAPPMEAPPMEAPPMEAPPMEAPPMEAPPMEAPPMEAPTMEAPPSKPLPTKAPAAKKKARTLTELATAPYVPSAVPDIDLLAPGNSDSLLKYFDSDGQVKALVEHQVIKMDRANSKPKKAPKAKKKKAMAVKEPSLLSPNSALKMSTSQDFVFGTSSQLILEDSPTMLRDLQAAMQASNRPDREDDPFASSPTDQTRRRGLWHAGARDVDGDLLAAESLDLVDASGIAQDAQTSTSGQVGPREVEFVDIRDICSSPPQIDPLPNKSVSDSLQSQQPPAGSEMVQATTAFSSSSAATQNMSNSESSAPTPRPKFELLTDAQLARQITSYGFKPVKRRQAMIALLDQCWTSQHPGSSSGLTSIGSAAPMSTSSAHGSPKKSTTSKARTTIPPATAGPAKKPRGRPKKNDQPSVSEPTSPKRGRGRPRKTSIDGSASASKPPIGKPETPAKRKKATRKAVEIADSDNDEGLTVSSPSSPEPVFSSPPELDLSMAEENNTSLNMTPTEQEITVFMHITKAVTSAPPSKDAANPSWHEKMLLYDPVVLEDLATWLNSGQLTRVGYDGEVSPSDVKKWCESKSVICLWRSNLRGKERKRY
jgi:hypothetical protein